jgi:hypothetical protein
MRKKLVVVFTLFAIFQNSAQSQFRDTVKCKAEIIASLPKSLHEVSGMAYTAFGFWFLNDGDNGSYLMLAGSDGIIKKVKRVVNGPNYDWEDLASDPSGNLYIGDIGNNLNIRRSLQVYIIKNPNKAEGERVSAEKIEIEYSDQQKFPPEASRMTYDAEAMVFYRDSIFIFNKNRTIPYDGYVKLYGFPAKPGKYNIKPIDSVFLGGRSSMSGWVTGAAISSTGKLALLSHDKIWLIPEFRKKKFSQSTGRVLKLNHYSQKEAICFDEEENIFVADELFERLLGGKLYRISPNK